MGGNYVVVAAGGQGRRTGNLDLPKQYASIAGKTILEHTLGALLSCKEIDGIQVVLDYKYIEHFHELKNRLGPRIIGSSTPGETRAESVFSGLKDIKNLSPKNVFVHDGVRPFVSVTLVERLLKAMSSGAFSAVPYISPSDTQVLLQGDKVQIIPRKSLISLQTPQLFDYQKLIEAYEICSSVSSYTDDFTLFTEYSQNFVLIPGDYQNIKITYNHHIDLAKAMLNAQ